MGELTPEIFDVLARTATYKNQKRVGRRNGKKIKNKPDGINGHGKEITNEDGDLDNLDDFKNAIFQLIMLRARMDLERKISEGTYNKTCSVQLNITFTPADLGKGHNKLLEELDNLEGLENIEGFNKPNVLESLSTLTYSDLKALMFWDIIPTTGTVLPSDSNDAYTADLADLIESGAFPLACA